MTSGSKAVLTALGQVRTLIGQAEAELRPDTEYLRDELRRLLDLVDTLEGKVEKEERLTSDKEALQ